MLNRRRFLQTGAAALPLASLKGLHAAALDNATGPILTAQPALAEGPAPKRWEQNVRRIGQLNMTEHDPIALNVQEWADYWASLKTDVVFISVTGILAFYPTQVPFHRRGKFLGNRDLFGECCDAARKKGIKIVARMSPDLNWADDALTAHPEWAQRNADGSPRLSGEDHRLFWTCMFSTYMTDYMPAIIREINARYDVDAHYTNGWPSLGNLPICYCEQCRKLPPSGTPAYWDKYNERAFSLWRLYDGITKEKKPTSFYFANLGGSLRASLNLAQLGEFCPWFHADNQGRGTENAPVWGGSLQGRVCRAVMKDGVSASVTAAYATGAVRWRNSSKGPAEAAMWLNQSLATGMIPDYHFVGGETGLGEDRRWHKTGRDYYQWMSGHDAHFTYRASLANIGVVMGQRTQLFYKPPVGSQNSEYANGIYSTLLDGRFAFDFVHEDQLDADRLSKYRALILPNIALLSDKQCAQLRAYAKSGGSLLATFETSMYDEHNTRRSDFGLADVFGIKAAGPVIGTNGNPYYGRIERRHPVLEGFHDTNWLPGAENRLPLAPVSNPVLTVVPGFVAYPPELAYPPVSHTSEPAIVVRENGPSRVAYLPGDVERTMWQSGNTDLNDLLLNAIRWVSHDERPYAVSGDGLLETIAWQTDAGYALHLLNYNNPHAFQGWLRTTHPVGPQSLRLQLPAGVRAQRVELLRAGHDVPFEIHGQTLQFTVPAVGDYEVAGISVA